MNQLQSEFDKLLKITDKEKIETKIQHIMAVFLTDYFIKVYNKTVEPLEVEAYYFNPGIFEDKYVHCEKGLQDNHFGQPYFHRMNDGLKLGTYKGMDICLSNMKNVYFALLIRSAVIDGENVYGPSNCVKKIFENDENYKTNYQAEEKNNVLAKNFAAKNGMRIFYGKRYGLSLNVKGFDAWQYYKDRNFRMFIGEFRGKASVKIKSKSQLSEYSKIAGF